MAVAPKQGELTSQIENENQKQMKEPLLISMFNTSNNAGKSTEEINGRFAFSQLLTDCLLQLESTQVDRKELMAYLEQEYAGNSVELTKLRQFEKECASENTVWWYTRDSFFYRTLNAALRKQDMHLIFLYRLFIVYMYRQLQEHKCSKPIRVYRIQLMSTEEIKNLEQNQGNLISINSFFSTSKNSQITKMYNGGKTDQNDLGLVLFEINADPSAASKKPFADITKISQFEQEAEVLFMLGSIFRLESVKLDEDKIWKIRMSLCDEKELGLKEVLKEMKRRYGITDANLGTFGKLLWKMGICDLAEKYYTRFIHEIPKDDPSLIYVYGDLADIASQRGDTDKSLEWHKKIVAIKEQNPAFDCPKDLLKIADQDLKLEDEIGCGGVGRVYRARWRHDIVAVKRLHINQMGEQSKKEFFNELSIMHLTRSPNIVNFYGACMERGNYALVMEYMSLGSLYKVLHKDKLPLDWTDRLSIALQAAKGINYLHQLSQPIFHCDVKSSNLLLEKSHEKYIAKICDFGLAKTREETTRTTQLKQILACTLQWTAPEILNMKKHSDRSDVYSLGMVYWELTTYEIPYYGYLDAVIREFVLSGARLDIPDATPSKFSALIKKCWAHDPVDRPSCSQLIEVIEQCSQENHQFRFFNASGIVKVRIHDYWSEKNKLFEYLMILDT